MFGKILKKIKNLAPLKRDSSAVTYGLGTTANYGHVKTINGLTQASHANGLALSAYQGKVLNDKIESIYPTPIEYAGNILKGQALTTLFTFNAKDYKVIDIQGSSIRAIILNIISPNILSGIARGSASPSEVQAFRVTLTSVNQPIHSQSNSYAKFYAKISGTTITILG